jgi:hypothetical protein
MDYRQTNVPPQMTVSCGRDTPPVAGHWAIRRASAAILGTTDSFLVETSHVARHLETSD